MKILRLQLIVGVLLAVPSALFSDTIGYSIASSSNDLYKIDLSNGMATDLGAINTSAVLGGIAAFSSSLYAVSTSDNGNLPSQLYNVTMPPGTLVGDTGPRFGNTTGAAYRPQDGYIYDLQGMTSLSPGTTQSALYQIDPSTGKSTLLGMSPTYANGLAIAPNGTGYATDFQETGALYRLSSSGPYSLTSVGSFGLGVGGTGFNSGAAFDSSGTLYVLREDGAIFTVATSGAHAGAATFDAFVTDSATDSRVASSLEGLAVSSSTSATPEPATLLLLLPGMLLVAFFLWRKQQAH